MRGDGFRTLMLATSTGTEFRMYVRSQPPEPGPDPFDLPHKGAAFARFFLAGSLAFPDTPVKGPPTDELPREEAQCLRLVLDLAQRTGRTVEVIDVSRALAPRDVLEDGEGSPGFFPVLIRPDGARLAGESDFTPRRVRRFLAGRPVSAR